MEKEFHDLFRKCQALEQGQFMYTTFGPDRYYKIQKTDDSYFNIAEFKNKWGFQQEGKLLSHDSFNTVETLRRTVLRNPDWYATNVFSGKLVHFDNWVNFVKAFVPAIVEEYNYGDEKNYYVKRLV
jgi:hypothetical protein